MSENYVRAGMVYLVDIVRRMVNDLRGVSMQFDDLAIQESLDQNRRYSDYFPLNPVRTIFQGGSVDYFTFEAPRGYWEGTVGLTLVDGGYGTLTPGTADNKTDLLTGRWTFGTAPTRPVMVTGWTYDVYGASADLLDQWLSTKVGGFDFSTDGLSYKRSQEYSQIAATSAQYRLRSDFSRQGTMHRSDSGEVWR